MKKITMLACSALLLLSSFSAVAGEPFRELSWSEMIPPDYNPGAAEAAILSRYDISQMSDDSPEAQKLLKELHEASMNAPVNEKLDKQQVVIPGFVVPLDLDGEKVRNFLLVPYFGACIHTPPPPPNQIIYVEASKPFKVENNYIPFNIYGTISATANQSELGTAGYSMKMDKATEYE